MALSQTFFSLFALVLFIVLGSACMCSSLCQLSEALPAGDGDPALACGCLWGSAHHWGLVWNEFVRMRKQWVAWSCKWRPLTTCLPSGHCSCCFRLVQPDKILLKWGKSVILGVVYFSYCNFVWYSNLCAVILVFSMLTTLARCMEAVSRGCSLTYTRISWYSFCFHCLFAPPALTVWKMQDIPFCLILCFPLCLAVFFATFTPKPSSDLFYSSLPESSPQAGMDCTHMHRCMCTSTHIYIQTSYFHVDWEDSVVYILSHLLPWPFQITHVKFWCYFSLSYE